MESGRVIYQQLLNREQELSIARSSAIGNVRIIDPARDPAAASQAEKALVVVLGVLLGLFVSAGWILARSMLGMGIETPGSWRSTGLTSMPPYRCSEWLAKRCVCVKKTLCPQGCAIRPNISLPGGG